MSGPEGKAIGRRGRGGPDPVASTGPKPMPTDGSVPNADRRGNRAGGVGPDVGGTDVRPAPAPPPVQSDPTGAMDGSPVPGTAMPEEPYADWHAKLTEAQKRWVAAAIEGLRGCCDDPEALVRADMASPEYALVARQHLFGDLDQPFRKSSGGSLVGLRLVAKDYGGDRGAAALRAMDRMVSAGISQDDILDFYEWVRSSARGEMRAKIDEAQEFYVGGFPGWVMMELVDDKAAGRIISGGERFNPGAYALDPWRGGRPVARPWDARCFRDEEPGSRAEGAGPERVAGDGPREKSFEDWFAALPAKSQDRYGRVVAALEARGRDPDAGRRVRADMERPNGRMAFESFLECVHPREWTFNARNQVEELLEGGTPDWEEEYGSRIGPGRKAVDRIIASGNSYEDLAAFAFLVAAAKVQDVAFTLSHGDLFEDLPGWRLMETWLGEVNGRPLSIWGVYQAGSAKGAAARAHDDPGPGGDRRAPEPGPPATGRSM